MTLAELKTKYGLGDGAKYEPKDDCKFCKGVGERYKDGVGKFCICLYVDHSMSDFAGDGLSELAKKLKKESSRA